MQSDNTTPMNADEYDKEIRNTIPYYDEFYVQTISVVKQMQFHELEWLDLGCGTGTMSKKASDEFDNVHFVMADPSAKMLERAKQNCLGMQAEYINLGTEAISLPDKFNVVTAIQSHHYLQPERRKNVAKNVYCSLKNDGIYVMFENIIPESEESQQFEKKRWGMYQSEHGKSEDDVNAHLARCGVNYFPLTINEHIELLEHAGFRRIQNFWLSYMQAGFYAIK